MREIKFRAWQDNKMVYQPMSGNYALTRFAGFLYEDAIVMQYTGLEDKNGKEIYEGDIIFNDDRKTYGVVKFIERYAGFYTEYEEGEIYPLWESISNLYYSVGNFQ
jgi:uncharacterized phage protein (TIGR01671 family)